MQDQAKGSPVPDPGKEKQEKDTKSKETGSEPEIIHIGSGGAFTESEGDMEDDGQDQGQKTEETPY